MLLRVNRQGWCKTSMAAWGSCRLAGAWSRGVGDVACMACADWSRLAGRAGSMVRLGESWAGGRVVCAGAWVGKVDPNTNRCQQALNN